MRELKLRCPNPNCRVMLSIPLDSFGRMVRCAGCGHSFLAPISHLARWEHKTTPKRYRKAS